jgi:ABC-type branched-subunit amino acid transport system substrate-binding protein
MSLLGGSSPTIFECDSNLRTPCTSVQGRRFEYLVGVQPSATSIFPPAISLTRVQGAKTVGIFRETGANELYFQAVRQGALDGADDNRMQVVLDITVPYSGKLNDEAKANMKQVIAQLQQAQPDIVAGAVFAAGCHAFIQAAQEMNYTAPAFLLSVCTSDAPTFKKVLGDAGRYVTGTTLWDRRLSGRVFKEDSSSLHFFPATPEKASPQIFWDTFVARFGYSPSYHAACQFACSVALQGAAELSNSLDTEDMRLMINRLSHPTFYGLLQFNSFGQIVETQVGATVQFNGTGDDVIVLPIAASASELVYPMPEWNERQEAIVWYGRSEEQGIIVAASIGILACFIMMALFASWRDRPQIIASSLLFVELIILGAAMIYASLFFWVLETTTAMCNLRYWLSGVGFVLMFSALLTKTWRVWRIFHEHSLKMMKLTNIYLLRIMAVALSVEILVLAVWSGAFTPEAETVVLDENRPILNYRTCTTEDSLPFAIILIIFKAALILAGVVLGFWSRKIRSEYNESKFILIAMYNITFAALILLVLFAIGISDRYIDFLIRSIAILWGVTATLCILLIPKIYYVATGSNDPTRKPRGSTWSTPPASSLVPDSLEVVQEQLELLSRREQQLRERLAELKAQDRKMKSNNDSTKTSTAKSANSSNSQQAHSVTSTKEV